MSLSHSVESFLGHVPTYYCRRNEESTSSTHIKERHAYTRQRTPRHRRHLGWHRTDSGHQRLQLVRFPADERANAKRLHYPRLENHRRRHTEPMGVIGEADWRQSGGSLVDPPPRHHQRTFFRAECQTGYPDAQGPSAADQRRRIRHLGRPFTSPERDTGVRGRHSGCIGWRQPTPVVLT